MRACCFVLTTARVQREQVAPKHRRKGVARALVAEGAALAAARGCARLNLHVRVDDTPAEALYASCGFVKVGEDGMPAALFGGRRRRALLEKALE